MKPDTVSPSKDSNAEYHKATLGLPLSGPIGAKTQYQLAAILDGAFSARALCHRILSTHPHFGAYHKAKLEKLDALMGASASLASIVRTLTLWKRHCGQEASLATVEQFLWVITAR